MHTHMVKVVDTCLDWDHAFTIECLRTLQATMHVGSKYIYIYPISIGSSINRVVILLLNW